MSTRLALLSAALLAFVVGILVAVEAVQVWRIAQDIHRIMEGAQ